MVKDILRFFRNQWLGKGISLPKTLLANMAAFGWPRFLKFPIWVYQGTRIESLGRVRISAPLSPGMVRIGQRKFFHSAKTVIINRGTMEFGGNCAILGGTTVNVLGHTISFGKEVMVGEGCKILVGPSVSIGDYSRIAFGTTIMSADFHSVINIATGAVKRSLAPIAIGRYNWIGCNCTIKKGTVTPDWCIVSGNSLLLKDYSCAEAYPFLAGAPAKLKGHGLRRVYNARHSEELRAFFEDEGGTEATIPPKAGDPAYDWYCGEDIKVHIN